jgi:hypothetical protein
MNNDQLTGIVRAILATAGGALVAKGLVDQSTMLSVVGGLTSVVVALWSHYTHRPVSQ